VTKEDTLEFKVQAKRYVWYVNTIVFECKVNLVLNNGTCFEAPDGSGGRVSFIFNII